MNLIESFLNLFKRKPPKPVVDYACSCGRTYLTINGFIVLMEGTQIIDADLAKIEMDLYRKKYENGLYWGIMKTYNTGTVWSADLIKYVATIKEVTKKWNW